jgi:hypothetical protein
MWQMSVQAAQWDSARYSRAPELPKQFQQIVCQADKLPFRPDVFQSTHKPTRTQFNLVAIAN